MHDLLFVYGSLLSRIAHPMGEKLRGQASLIGPASIQARLYRVDWYPCIALSPLPADRVYGELYRLHDPAVTWPWLDEYEGITPGPAAVAAADQYERVTTSVTGTDGATATAWIYNYRQSVARFERVATGRWDG